MRIARRPALAASVVAVIVGWAVPGNVGRAVDPPPGGPVAVVVSAGDPTTAIDLTPVVTATMAEAVTTTSTLTVTSAAPDGSFVATETIDSVESTVDLDSAVLTSGFGTQMLGVPLQWTSNHQGLGRRSYAGPTALTADQERAMAYLSSDQLVDITVLPESPVGVGATWTVTNPSGITGVAGWSEYTYRLAAFDGETFTIEYSYALDFSGAPVSGDGIGTLSIVGTRTGSGSIEGHLSNPFVQWVHGTSTSDCTITVEGNGPVRFAYQTGYESISTA